MNKDLSLLLLPSLMPYDDTPSTRRPSLTADPSKHRTPRARTYERVQKPLPKTPHCADFYYTTPALAATPRCPDTPVQPPNYTRPTPTEIYRISKKLDFNIPSSRVSVSHTNASTEALRLPYAFPRKRSVDATFLRHTTRSQMYADGVRLEDKTRLKLRRTLSTTDLHRNRTMSPRCVSSIPTWSYLSPGLESSTLAVPADSYLFPYPRNAWQCPPHSLPHACNV